MHRQARPLLHPPGGCPHAINRVSSISWIRSAPHCLRISTRSLLRAITGHRKAHCCRVQASPGGGSGGAEGQSRLEALQQRKQSLQKQLDEVTAQLEGQAQESKDNEQPVPGTAVSAEQPPVDQATDSKPTAGSMEAESKSAAGEQAKQGPGGQRGPKSGSQQAGLSLEQMEAAIKWPAPEETQAWERETSSLDRPGRKSSDAGVPEAQHPLHIVHISAEFAPVAKVGGLGDVVTGLARACLEMGHRVEVVLPFYQCLPESSVSNLRHAADFDVPKGSFHDGQLRNGSLRISAHRGEIEGIPVVLLRPDWGATNLFQGDRIYGGSYNETEAYLVFSRASLEWLKVSGSSPHVLHVHEWQTAAVPMLFWEDYAPAMKAARLIFTIHNMDSQGECRQEEFAATGTSGAAFADVGKALDERTIGHNPERLCLMKGGMVFSNVVTTVSPTYAHEALSGGAAGWLRSTLVRPDVQAKFTGILNGIDTGLWDPWADPILPAPFDHHQPEGKQLCKRFLQQALQLDADPGKPLVVAITRLVPQKGIHLLRHAAYRTAHLGGQYVLLGSGHADGDFRHMAGGDFRDSRDVRLMITYSDRLAHLLYAAADIILVPSLFEPCGLTQLVGMRYGAVPVVRKTGGLADTVKDVSEGKDGTGYVFSGTDEGSLDSALDRAIQDFREQPDRWATLAAANMAIDWSWQNSAAQYLSLYEEMLQS